MVHRVFDNQPPLNGVDSLETPPDECADVPLGTLDI
jgi:hypothetical protein